MNSTNREELLEDLESYCIHLSKIEKQMIKLITVTKRYQINVDDEFPSCCGKCEYLQKADGKDHPDCIAFNVPMEPQKMADRYFGWRYPRVSDCLEATEIE
jgi:hypothetical protein